MKLLNWIKVIEERAKKGGIIMILKRTMSAVIAVVAAASTMVCFAVSANAATTTLSYEKDGVSLSSYTYTAESNDTYTLNSASLEALQSAQDGDTLTITFKVASEGTARYRAGLNFMDQQFYVNAHNRTGQNGSFNSGGACHLNANLADNDSATVTYEIELNAGGTAKTVTASLVAGNGTAGYKAEDSVAGESLNSILLNTASRGESGYDSDFITISDFSAVLTTADPEEPSEPVVIAADPYTYETDDTLANADAKGFTATVDGEEGVSKAVTWYASIDGGSEWKELEGDSTIVTGGSAKFGVILFDIPKEATDVKAGYVFE